MPGDGGASGERHRAGLATAAVAASALLVLLATLPPSRGPVGQRLGFLCVACGERGVADFILNIGLFAPVGAALAARGCSTRRALLVGVLTSIAIEAAQRWIPGRQPALGDIVANGLGALLGAGLFARFLRSRALRRVPASAAAVPVALLVLTGWLLRPAYPPSTYYGQWTPELGGLGHYGGRVLEARLGALPLPPHRVPDSGAMRRLLSDGATLTFDVEIGRPPARLAPIVSIFDERSREILLVGAEGPDLVVHRRSRAAGWRLAQPEFRFARALAGLSPGDTVRVRVTTAGPRLRAEVGDAWHASNAVTLGSGWTLLHAWGASNRAVGGAVGALWLALGFGVVGFALGASLAGAAAALALTCAALVLVPWVTGLAATTAGGWAAALLGASLGLAPSFLAQSPGPNRPKLDRR